MKKTPHRNGFAAKIGLSPTTGRIMTSRQGRQMIARRRGLWAVKCNRPLGFPNLVKGRALHSLYRRWRRSVRAAELHPLHAEGAWNAFRKMPLREALKVSEESLIEWMRLRAAHRIPARQLPPSE
jgi:hypothetical protein